VARGTHEELMGESPIYAEIYCSQLQQESYGSSGRDAPGCSQFQGEVKR
jgi:hypothetical protein